MELYQYQWMYCVEGIAATSSANEIKFGREPAKLEPLHRYYVEPTTKIPSPCFTFYQKSSHSVERRRLNLLLETTSVMYTVGMLQCVLLHWNRWKNFQEKQMKFPTWEKSWWNLIGKVLEYHQSREKIMHYLQEKSDRSLKAIWELFRCRTDGILTERYGYSPLHEKRIINQHNKKLSNIILRHLVE